MDFKSNKISQPFNPNSNYFQGLSNNIQSRVGIEVKNVVETKAPIIEFNKKQKPIQLTVEFGFPLTAEKNIAVESNQNQDEEVVETNIATNQIIDSSDNLVKDDEIGQIHIEPIQLAANVNPYWHNFNSDDELEGLVLDSEGQEMSDITINGDAMFDIDQHFLQKGKSEIVVTEVPAVINEIIETLPVVKEIDFVTSEESPIDIENIVSVVMDDDLPENSILSVVNDAEVIANDISSVVDVDDNQAEEAFFSFSFAPEISVVSEVAPVISESDLSIELPHTTENIQEIEYSFSDAELDNLHEQMSQQVETTHSEQNVVKNKQSETAAITFVEFSTNEIVFDPEREYSDAELDLLHEQLSKEIEASKPRVSEPVSIAENVKVKPTTSNHEPVIEAKTPFMEMIPWSSVFGIVASLMAIASAWFIWNSIQKPIAIDEFIDSKIAPMLSQAKSSVQANQIDKTLSLAPADFIVNEILEEVENPSKSENNFNFVSLCDQSKISAVVLESNGLTTLELEDGFFEDLGI